MPKTLAIEPARPPLTRNDDGAFLIGESRGTLDTLVRAFKTGATAEQIAQQYPSPALEDIYTTIGFDLRNPDAAEDYLKQRDEFRAKVQHENEARFDPNGIRDRVMARSHSGENNG